MDAPTLFQLAENVNNLVWLAKIGSRDVVDILAGLLIGVVVVFLFFYWSGTRFNPYNYATNICKVMLHSYQAVRAKYPDMHKEELYVEAMLLRPTIDPETAKFILEERKERLNDPRKLQYWMIVLKMIEYEFYENNDTVALGTEKTLNFFKQFKKAVTANIPTDI